MLNDIRGNADLNLEKIYENIIVKSVYTRRISKGCKKNGPNVPATSAGEYYRRAVYILFFLVEKIDSVINY